MIVHFCPQCGTKAKDEFTFCPNCGLKLPREEREDVVDSGCTVHTSPVKYSQDVPVQNEAGCSSSTQVTRRRAGCRISPEAAGTGNLRSSVGSPSSPLKRKLNITPEKEPAKRNTASPAKAEAKGSKSPRSKKSRNVQVEPLPERETLTDTQNNTEWLLVELLKERNGLYYNVQTQSKKGTEHAVLKLDAKEGKIFNEQNFFQRAAKKKTVDQWKRSHDCPALGIPSCIGFGVHNDYRFLVFSALGKNLQTVIDEVGGRLSDIAVYQIVYRLIDVLEYIHENEYVHGDITAENLYVNPDYREVYLAGYYNAFRYCPNGSHVPYREGITTCHEGTVEFISLDLHKGARPTRRSDLESLGYCMLKWLCGSLPWSDVDDVCSIMEHKKRHRTDLPGLLKECFNRRKIADVAKQYLETVIGLNYEEKPDYNKIRNYLSDVLQKAHVGPYDPVKL
ncbi:serine/threonine-protein kinase VRK3 [Dendropsophus ebraccatus]|uniref:serine/threonine-protein kinase VRK3 n=1 Tax=Dendropsophus ebraccatus TaxID=150705 RepID=UPI003831DCF8